MPSSGGRQERLLRGFRIGRESASQIRRAELLSEIKNVHTQSRGIYGSPRVFVELKAQGIKACKNTVAKIMSQAEIRSKTVKRYVPNTTDSRHDYPVADNVLDRKFEACAVNRKWVTDITYIETAEGWLYLAGVLDLHSRKVIGWSMADQMKTELVEDALMMAASAAQSRSRCAASFGSRIAVRVQRLSETAR